MVHLRRVLYTSATLALAGVLLYFALRGIAWGNVWTLVKGARAEFLALAAVTVSFSTWVRAMRWRILLSAQRPVPAGLAFWATSAGYFGNNVLPARAGELIRTLIISRTTGMSMVFVLTTALSERVADAITLITIAAGVLLTMPVKPGWLAGVATPFAIAGLGGVAAIALVPMFEEFWLGVLRRLPFPDRFRKGIEQVLRQVLDAMRSFHSVRRLAGFAAMTAAAWSLDAVASISVAHAIGLTMTPPVAFLLLAGLGLGSALPSTPGYVGVYQFVAVSILTPFGFTRDSAIAFIVLLQAVIYVAVLFWGGIGLSKYRKLARP